MFPPRTAIISPHLEGGFAGAIKLARLTAWHQPGGGTLKLPWKAVLQAKDIVSVLLAILGITITSGVCYMTLCQAHPIFAYEGNLLTLRAKVEQKAEVLTPAKIEENEYQAWVSRTNTKYNGLALSYPAKGIAHVKVTRWVNGKPIKLNIVEINPKANAKLQIKPKTASQSVLNRKASIRNIAKPENSIVAINGGYFKPQTGVPLGTLVINKNVLTGPIYNRVALGINTDNTFSMERSGIDITVKGKKAQIKADNINQPRMLSTYTLCYTEKWGNMTPQAPKYGVAVAIKDGIVVNKSEGSVEIPKGGFAIVGPRQNIAPILNEKNIKMDIKFHEAFKDSEHIIGGGPYLVKNGEMYVDIKEERFGAINGKNPRTAIGYTENNELIIVTVDGREETSVGMTLWELSRVMKTLGCKNAMNLDGGGSSVIYVKGRIENNPAYKEGIAISNAVLIGEKVDTEAIAAAE